MTVLNDVQKLITRRNSKPICDDCITKSLGLSVRQHANHKTRELAELPGFDRRKDVCSVCGEAKLVIRRA